jgi:hypothetical protein
MKPSATKFALVIAEQPKTKNPDADERNWRDFLSRAKTDGRRPKDNETLNESAWLIPLHTGLKTLSDLIHRAQDDGISIRVLFLDEEPAWIRNPPA